MALVKSIHPETLKLYAVALLIFAVIAGYFYQQDKIDTALNQSKSTVDYQAKDITIIKTNIQGQPNLKVTAKTLRQNDEQWQLENIKGRWFVDAQNLVTIDARHAIYHPRQERLLLSDNVAIDKVTVVTAYDEDSQVIDQSKTTIETQALTMDMTTQVVTSESPVIIRQGESQANISQLVANMATGVYQTGRIEAVILPSNISNQ